MKTIELKSRIANWLVKKAFSIHFDSAKCQARREAGNREWLKLNKEEKHQAIRKFNGILTRY